MGPAEQLPTAPVFGDLIPLGPSTSTLADTDTVNLGQARHELNRAIDFGNVADRAAWAERWGESALTAVEQRSRFDPDDAEFWGPPDKSDVKASLTAVQSAFDRYLEAPSEMAAKVVRETINATREGLDKL